MVCPWCDQAFGYVATPLSNNLCRTFHQVLHARRGHTQLDLGSAMHVQLPERRPGQRNGRADTRGYVAGWVRIPTFRCGLQVVANASGLIESPLLPRK